MRALRIGALVLLISVIGFALFLRWAEPETAPASLVFAGGTILTLADPPLVEAVWVEDGRIRQLGDAEVVRAAAGKGASALTMRNEKGVVITLQSDVTGAQLTLGAQALTVEFK